MSDRTMHAGDTWPPLKGSAVDSAGNVVRLQDALSITVLIVSAGHTINQPATVINPPEADPDGIHFWNWKYNFQAGDTVAGEYTVELKVLWAAGELETFPNEGAASLTIEAT